MYIIKIHKIRETIPFGRNDKKILKKTYMLAWDRSPQRNNRIDQDFYI